MRPLRSFLIIAAFISAAFLPRPPGFAAEFVIAVDIGHSPANPGALSARNRPEYDYNRKMASVFSRELSKNPRFRVVIINPKGNDISLARRAELINNTKPDLLVSVHHNSTREHHLSACTVRGKPARFCNLFRGYSVFVSEKNPKYAAGRAFALRIGEQMRKAGFLPSNHPIEIAEGKEPIDIGRGVYRYDNLVVLRDVKCPALLLECGIIKNRSEEMFLRNRSYRLRLAKSVRAAIESTLK